RAMAAKGLDPAVYGPVPEEEVSEGVAYWNKEKIRHIDTSTKLIVSRAPPAVRNGLVLPRKKADVLWLQDAPAIELSPATADDYEHIVVLTEWHRQRLAELHGVDPKRMTVI